MRAGRGAGPADAGAAGRRRDGRGRRPTEDEVAPRCRADGRRRSRRSTARASVVVSGDRGGGATVVAALRGRGAARPGGCGVSHAFHSPLMEPMLAEFARGRAGLTFARAADRRSSPTVTGEPVDADELRTPEYWVRHVREAGPVRRRGRARCAERRHRAFVEVGPDARADRAGRRTPSTRPTVAVVAALRRGPRRGRRRCSPPLAGLHVARRRRRLGGAASPAPARAGSTCRPTPSSASATGSTPAAAAGDAGRGRARRRRPPAARRRGRRCPTPAAWLLTGRLSLADPAVAGRPRRARRRSLLPGTALRRAGAARPATRSAPRPVEELTLEAPLVLPPTRRRRSCRSRSARRRRRPAPGRDPLPARGAERRPSGPGTPPACSPRGAGGRRRRPGRVAAGGRRAGRRSTASTSGWPTRAATTARRSRACARSGGAATRSSPRSRCPSRRRRRPASACTRRCSTRRCTRLGAGAAATDGVRLPFAWSGVALHAAGAGDAAGAARPPAAPDAVPRRRSPTRPARRSPRSTRWRSARSTAAQLGGPADAASLFGVEWAAAGRRRAAEPPGRRSRSATGYRPPRAGADRRRRPRRGAARDRAAALLALLQAWLADPAVGRRPAGRARPPARSRERGRRPGRRPRCGAWCARRRPSTRAGSLLDRHRRHEASEPRCRQALVAASRSSRCATARRSCRGWPGAAARRAGSALDPAARS